MTGDQAPNPTSTPNADHSTAAGNDSSSAVTASQEPPYEGDAKGWESSHSGPGRGQVLASGDGSEGRSLLPDDSKGLGAAAADRTWPSPFAYGAQVPEGFQTCNTYRDGVQTNHLVRWVGEGHMRGTPGRTVLCGLTRFDSKPGANDADLPGWSMGGGVFGPHIRQQACPACWEAAGA